MWCLRAGVLFDHHLVVASKLKLKMKVNDGLGHMHIRPNMEETKEVIKVEEFRVDAKRREICSTDEEQVF